MVGTRRGQAGAGLLSTLFCVLLVGFLLMVGIRLAPVYYDYMAIKASMDEVAASGDARGKGRRQLWDMLYRHFDVNGIDYLQEKDFRLQGGPQGKEMVLDYAVRRPLFGSVELLIHFHHAARLR